MGYVRTRRFCCCLPVRFGVFVMGILGIVGGGLVAGAAWKQVMGLTDAISMTNKIALYIQAVLYTLLAVLSLFGLVGTIIKGQRLVSAYSVMLWVHFGFSVGTGAFFLYSLFHETGQEDIAKCINGSDSTIQKDVCKGSFAVLRGVIVGVLVLIWLIELYGGFIVSNYAGQLEEEDAAKLPMGPPAGMVIGNPTPPPQMATTYGGYSFSAPNQSYGSPGNV
ncbi:hypothetical protein PLICRDRAFT_31775 [Plicaturopsis crispa FD-325 SS-3]|nr:hypothetical protein PLICRDRAFT_31775 [Plicaturopsis crispa FD-325 SS-3]